MKITDLQVSGFGIWKELTIGELADTVTVFYGRNEAGKTTLMQFVRTMLYGFSPERRERYVTPLGGERAGGTLNLSVAGTDYRVRRQLEAGDDSASPGEVLVTADDGTREGPSRLLTLLGGVDEQIFSNVFAVGLREIQELATLNDTAAAEQLYKLTGGLDRVSLVDVMRELGSSRERLLSASDRPSQIVHLLSQCEKLQAEIEELSSQSDRWSQLLAHRAALQDDIRQAEEGVSQAQRQARQAEVALQLRERWERRSDLARQAAQIGPLPPLPERVVEKLDRLAAQLAVRLEQAEQLRRRRTLVRQEAGELPVNRKLWSLSSRIEALNEHAPWIASLQGQIEGLRTEVARCDKELGVYYEQLGGQPASLASLPDVPRRKLALLRDPARAIGQEQRRLTEAQEVQARAAREASAAVQDLETALVERDQTDLASALDQAGDRAAKFRRRIALEERTDQMLRRRDDLEEEELDLRENQVLPVRVLAAVGACFVLGVMLILTGFFGGLLLSLSGALNWSLLGCVITAAAVAAKFVLERRAAQRLAECTRLLANVQNEIKQSQRDRDALDRELPRGGGQLDSRLRAAEAEVEALEALLPLESQRHAGEERAKSAQAAAADAEVALKAARHRWRAVLRSIGLPEDLTPKQAQQFAQGCGRTARLRKRRETRLEAFRERQKDLATFTARISQLFQEAGLQPEEDDPLAQLRQLTMGLTQQRQAVERRIALQRQSRALRREYARLRQAAENLRRRRQAMIAASGAQDELQLRQFDELHRRSTALAQQREEISLHIAAALAGQFTEDAIAEEISHFAAGSLVQRREALAGQLAECQARLSRLYERRGEISHELKTLAADRRLAEARFELGLVEERLRESIDRWQVLAVTGRLLESIRELYETERQPETLSEASRYLERLTEGKYRRVWTPLGEQILKLDDERGNPLPLDVLSSGTREAVFLSLRLALAAAYARRGAKLPLVLDDVLVNFDNQRAQAAAAVLIEFARQGFQLLLFTCHEHIVQIFQAAGVEARHLPQRGEPSPALRIAEMPAPVAAALPPPPEPIKEPVVRKRRRRLVDEAPTPPTPPPLPARTPPHAEIAASDENWRDCWWLTGVDSHFLDDPILDPPEFPAETPLAIAEPERPRIDPLPARIAQTPPAILPLSYHDRRFTWESPEMYWNERSEDAA